MHDFAKETLLCGVHRLELMTCGVSIRLLSVKGSLIACCMDEVLELGD